MPWLPVHRGADVAVVGLRELFHRAHEFDDLAVPVPPAASGLWRILYAITARITGLDDPDGWADRQEELYDRGSFDAERVDEYLDRYRDRFDLFHPQRPWLQDPRLAEQCAKTSGANKLVFDRPAGNTQVWFGHYTDADPVPVSAAEAAWYLVAQLYYGASGRCTSRQVVGEKLANTNAGPLRGVMSYHPLGRSAFESLVLGVPAPMGRNEEPDLCPWERADLPDPTGGPIPVTWPGGLVTGRFQHALLLVPAPGGQSVTDAYVTWGRRLPAGPVRDPYVVQRFSKEGRPYALPADGARALWRDVDALLADLTDDAGSAMWSKRPEIISSAADLDSEVRVRAYGFDQDGQAKDRQWFTAITPPILRLLRDREAVIEIETLHKRAERISRRLTFVLKVAWRDAAPGKDRNGPWVRPAEAYYWARAQRVFWTHINRRTFEHGRTEFLRLGHETIDHVAGNAGHRPRFAQAIAWAHRTLSGGPTKQRRKDDQ
jgi:CRISPR system Cascade subunit CasA